ncbi:MAG TPA: MFS transporter [Puia sp.]|nr:MFS transporter [Puia sp.]
MFRAFQSRNYRLYFCGQSISQIGTWMQRTGVSWVIYTMTHSTFMLGLTIFASQFPSFLFSLLGGIFADRHNRYKILLVTQSASMIQAFTLAALLLTKHYMIWEVLGLSMILGLINSFDVPARQPLVHDLVRDKSELSNALALNSSMVNVARLTGPALSGIILEKYGAGICFLLNGLSFVAVLISLLLLKLPPYRAPALTSNMRAELSEGFAYLKGTPTISLTLLMLTAISLLVLPYDTLLPVFAKDVFKGNAMTYGYIYSFIGFGAICGTLLLASLRPGADLKKVLFINTIVLGLGLIFFALSKNFLLAVVFGVAMGFGAMSQGTISIMIIQIHSHHRMRGRMISYVAMAMFGMLPLGSLLVGLVSLHLGAANAMLVMGMMAIIIALLSARFSRKNRLESDHPVDIEEAKEIVTEKI